MGSLVLLGCTPAGVCQCVEMPRCTADQSRGAVVVRWRIQDLQNGRLFPRGQCCCAQSLPGGAAADACARIGQVGLDCPPTAAWYIDRVQLTAVSSQGQRYCFSTACPEAELTTEFCLPAATGATAGLDYDLQLTAWVRRPVGTGGGVELGAPTPAISPPAVRRRVQPGQIVNLDAVVLGVNPPATFMPDGGSDGLAPNDAGARCY